MSQSQRVQVPTLDVIIKDIETTAQLLRALLVSLIPAQFLQLALVLQIVEENQFPH